MDPLTEAARTLIGEASPTTVRAVLKLLLNDDAAPAPALPIADAPALAPSRTAAATAARAEQRAAARTVPTPEPETPPVARKRAATPGGRIQHPPDAAWDALRHGVVATMRERNVDFAGLAAAIGRSAGTVSSALRQRQPPHEALQALLRTWLHETPTARAVAAPATFPGRRANGSAAPAA